MRGFVLALQFLTRVPTPQVADFRPEDLAASSAWFPVVGALVGFAVAAALLLGTLVDPWLGALAALVAWVAITGALHLDGVADLADALGAAHRDRDRFLAVLRDPHVGSFGVTALVTVLTAKLVLLMLVARQLAPLVEALWIGAVAGLGRAPTAALAAELAAPVAAVVLMPAWARLGAVIWSQTLPPLAPGSAERFAWTIRRASLWAWTAALAAASAWIAPVLLVAPAALGLWWLYLKRRLGGMTGDCLGAGIEVCEVLMLLALASGVRPPG